MHMRRSVIKAGEPPKQIIPEGEYFVLKQAKPEPWMELPESAPLHSMHVVFAAACLVQLVLPVVTYTRVYAKHDVGHPLQCVSLWSVCRSGMCCLFDCEALSDDGYVC